MICDLAVADREELVYLLTEAAEFEHTVMCTYLYAQWSLKRSGEEGVSADEMVAIDRWRAALRQVAMEEMLHLSLVNNLLASIGAAPHLWRPDFPVARGYFPADVDFHLAPFDAQSIEHFVFLERPEGIDLQDGRGFVHESRYPRVVCSGLLTPTPREYTSQGHLYHGIAQAIQRLAGSLGESALFAGHGEAQLGSEEFPLPGLFEVRDSASALRAIDEIVLQGEGAPAHRADSHFQRFSAIRDELRALREARPDFEPAWPAAVSPVLTEYTTGVPVVRISDPLSRRLTDIGNAVYGLMVHVLAQVCAPAPLPSGLRQGLATVSSEVMRLAGVIGEACARLPAGPEYPGVNAGLTFALPRSFGTLVQANAAQILAERAIELAAPAREVAGHVPLPGVAGDLERLGADLARLHREYEEHFGDQSPATSLAPPPKPATTETAAPDPGPPDDVPAGGAADNEASTDCITLRFDPARCIHSRQCVLNAPEVFLANVEGPWLHPERVAVEHLVHVARSCPSGAISYQRLDGGAEESAPAVNTILLRENGPYTIQAALQMEAATAGSGNLFRATLCRCGQSRNKPFCDNSHRDSGFAASGEPPTRASDPLAQRGGPLTVTPVRNGPLSLRGPVEICSGTGRTVFRTEATRLCRCGASADKPFCDNSHLRIGFTTDSD